MPLTWYLSSQADAEPEPAEAGASSHLVRNTPPPIGKLRERFSGAH